jgi:hypothetical protein
MLNPVTTCTLKQENSLIYNTSINIFPEVSATNIAFKSVC